MKRLVPPARPGALVLTGVGLLATLGASTAAPAQDAADPPPYTLVLGIAQDGGYPQAGSDSPAWNDPALARLVSCLALVDPATGERWLFDATPDFKWQLRRLDEMAPRDTQPVVDGIFLTHAHVGHYTGLLHLGKEVMGAKEVPVWAMPRMSAFLRNNGPWSLLVERDNIVLRELRPGKPVRLNDRLMVTPISVPHRDELSETVGFLIDGPTRSLFFLPDIDKWELWDQEAGSGAVERILEQVDVAYLDGTFYADGEVPGRIMSEIRHPFISESMERFGKLPAAERGKIRFLHINRTNPAIVPDSAAQKAIRAAGFGLAEEGQRQDL